MMLVSVSPQKFACLVSGITDGRELNGTKECRLFLILDF